MSSRCIQADGIVDLIGEDHIHGNVNRAIEAQLADERKAPPRKTHVCLSEDTGRA